jgi:hypothetical protein
MANFGRSISKSRGAMKMAIVWITVALALLLPCESPSDQVELRVGVARIEITPDMPVALEGYQEPENRISTGVHDRLYVRAISFEARGKRIVLVSSDLANFMAAGYYQSLIRNRFNLRSDEFFLCAVHTHSGPQLTLNRTYPHPNNFAYTERFRDRLVEVIGEAISRLAPAKLEVGRSTSPVGVNRRKLMPDGSMKMAPNPDGPVDPAVLALSISRPGGVRVASLFAYACHSRSLRAANTLISGDIFGLAEQYVESTLGSGHISAAFAGASGDVDPAIVVDSFGSGPEVAQEPVMQGRLLGASVVRALERTVAAPSGYIRSANARVALPSKTEGQSRPVEVIAARVGEVAFLGLDCEALVEVGMAIKAASPFRDTFVVTICNGWSGYLPPGHRYHEGGYEVVHSGFGAAAADLLVRRAVGLLEGLR